MSHAHFAKVARVVLVEIGAVVVLTTGHAATTGVLAVFAYAAVACADVAAAVGSIVLAGVLAAAIMERIEGGERRGERGRRTVFVFC